MATAANEPTLPTVGRYRFPEDASRSLLSRQLLWTAAQGTGAAAIAAAGVAASAPALMVAGSLGLAVLAANLRRPLQAAAVAASTLGGVWSLSLFVDGASSGGIAGLQILLAGAVIGAGLAWMSADIDRWQLLQTTLAGVATVGVGWWAATRLLGGLPADPLYAGLHGAVFGLLASQSTVVAARQLCHTYGSTLIA